MRKWYRVGRLAQNLTPFSMVDYISVCIVFTPIVSDRGNLKWHFVVLHQLLYFNRGLCVPYIFALKMLQWSEINGPDVFVGRVLEMNFLGR